jgi:hypothetical protein
MFIGADELEGDLIVLEGELGKFKFKKPKILKKVTKAVARAVPKPLKAVAKVAIPVKQLKAVANTAKSVVANKAFQGLVVNAALASVGVPPGLIKPDLISKMTSIVKNPTQATINAMIKTLSPQEALLAADVMKKTQDNLAKAMPAIERQTYLPSRATDLNLTR